MTHKLENKLPHINQLINIFFAVLFLNTLSKAELNVLNLQINQIVVTLVLSYFILYTWWRHNDMYLSAVNRKFRFVVLGVFRIVLIILILNLQTVLYEQDLSAVFGFSILAILICITSIWQFSINFGPTYGKVRVLLKREIWTDALTLLAVAIVLFPLYFGVWPFSVVTGLTILVFLLLGIRPLARSLTHWKEATPPHRGGKTRTEFSRSTQSHRTPSRQGNIETRQSSKIVSRPSVNRPEKSSVTGKSIGGEQKQREKKDSTGSENNAGRATGSLTQVKTSEKSIVKTPRREQGEKKQSQRQPRKINKKPVNEIPEQPPRQVITDEAEKKTTMIERAEKPDAVKNESENFGKRNTKKRRPRFDDGDAVQDNESSQNKPANTEGDEGQVSFGRTPKKKTR